MVSVKTRTFNAKTAVNSSTNTITSNGHGFVDNEMVVYSIMASAAAIDGLVDGESYYVINKTTNTFELEDIDGTDVDTSGYSTYSSGGTANRIYQITTSYTTAQLFELKFAQSADVLYITHPSHEVSKLSRTGHTSWTLSEVDFAETGPYMDANTTATTITPASSGTGTGVNFTASSTTGVNGGDGWQTTDVGRILKFNSGEAVIKLSLIHI